LLESLSDYYFFFSDDEQEIQPIRIHSTSSIQRGRLIYSKWNVNRTVAVYANIVIVIVIFLFFVHGVFYECKYELNRPHFIGS